MAIAVQEFIQEETEQKLPLDRASTAQPIAKQHKAVEVTFKTSPLRRFTLDEFQHLMESGFFDEEGNFTPIAGIKNARSNTKRHNKNAPTCCQPLS